MIQYPGFDKIAFEIGPFGSFGRSRSTGTESCTSSRSRRLVAGACARRSPAPRGSRRRRRLHVLLHARHHPRRTLGYVLFYGLSFWAKDPWYPFKVWDGGMSFHGGLLGVLRARHLRRAPQAPIADVFDFAAPLPASASVRVRIGNFINGELWGKTTDVPWGFMVDGEGRHATQLYEAGLEGLCCSSSCGGTPRSRGRCMAPSGLFLVLYSLARITVEFWRVPDEHINYLAIPRWITMGMLLSLPMLLIG
jgi:phosphatidylglycerol:prolipoprotein diacylglycerol transferase